MYGEISVRNNFEEVLPFFKIAYLTIYPENQVFFYNNHNKGAGP